MINLPVEKVNRRESARLNVPLWLGKITEHFKFNIRRYLNPRSGICAMWVNSQRKALSYASCTKDVTTFVRRLFPNSEITPLSFRRLFVTLVYENETHLQGETMDSFLERLARSINTSTEAMKKHYNYSLGQKNSEIVQKEIEERFLLSTTSESFKTRLLNSISNSTNG